MKNFSTYLLVMFMIMFWISRIIVAVAAEMNMNFGGLTPLNLQMEIALLFITLVCIIMVIKRKLVGALIYLLAYGMYFGVDILNNIQTLLVAVEGEVNISIYFNLFMSVIGMIISIAVLLDMLADKGRKAHPKDNKTDWFYDNEQFDRKLDDRADKNNYRTM